MLTPLQLRDIYFDTVKELNPNDWQYASEIDYNVTNNDIVRWIGENEYPEVNENSALTTEQWNNLVGACRAATQNRALFDMGAWHDKNHCGTSHCLSGWAVSRFMKDPNFEDSSFDLPEFVNSYDFSNCTTRRRIENPNSVLGTVLLSEYVSPFFYLTEDENCDNASEVIMKNLIDVVLQEADRDGTMVDEPQKAPRLVVGVKKLFSRFFS